MTTVTPGDTPAPPVWLRLGARRYDLSRRVLVVGVVEVGETGGVDAVLRRADSFVAAGADAVELAGSRDADVTPLLEGLAARLDVPLAVNTGDARVLEAVCGAGAALGRDESGFTDPDYLAVAVRAGASVLTAHVGSPGPGDAVGEVIGILAERAGRARAAGLSPDQVAVDAGLDCGKTPPQRAALLGAGDELARLGHPLCLSVAAFEGRDAALAAAAYGAAHGARIVRTPDVAGTVRVVRIVERLLVAGDA